LYIERIPIKDKWFLPDLEGLRIKVNQDVLIPLQSMEILFEPSHLIMGRFVEFNVIVNFWGYVF